MKDELEYEVEMEGMREVISVVWSACAFMCDYNKVTKVIVYDNVQNE